MFTIQKERPPTLKAATAPKSWNHYTSDKAGGGASPPGDVVPGPFAGKAHLFPSKLKDYALDPDYSWCEPSREEVIPRSSDWMPGFDKQMIVQKDPITGEPNLYWLSQNKNVRSSDLSQLFGMYGCKEISCDLMPLLDVEYAQKRVKNKQPVPWFTPKMLTLYLQGVKVPPGGFPISENDDLHNLVNRMRGEGHYKFNGNVYTRYGEMHEDTALGIFTRSTTIRVNKAGYCPHPFLPRRGASSDGWFRTRDGRCELVEAKCPKSKADKPFNELALAQGSPFAYMFQKQFEMDCHGSATANNYLEYRGIMGTAYRHIPRDDPFLEDLNACVSWFVKDVVEGSYDMATAADWLAPHNPMKQTFLRMLRRCVELCRCTPLVLIQEAGDKEIGTLGQIIAIQHPSFKKRKSVENGGGGGGGGEGGPPAKMARRTHDHEMVEGFLRGSHEEEDPLGRAGEWMRKRDAARSAMSEDGAENDRPDAVQFEVGYHLLGKDIPLRTTKDTRKEAVDFLVSVIASVKLKKRLKSCFLREQHVNVDRPHKSIDRFLMDNWTISKDDYMLETTRLRGHIVFPRTQEEMEE